MTFKNPGVLESKIEQKRDTTNDTVLFSYDIFEKYVIGGEAVFRFSRRADGCNWTEMGLICTECRRWSKNKTRFPEAFYVSSTSSDEIEFN